ncbi:MAG: hypothetical protein R6X34_13685, partial [Chloroflexota bacterium]
RGRSREVRLSQLGRVLCDGDALDDRDLIRQRAWDYSATAFACHPKEYEALRQVVMEQYGPAYELLAPPEEQPPRCRRPPRKRQRRH